MKFKYVATLSDGKKKRGVVDACCSEEASCIAECYCEGVVDIDVEPIW